MISKAIISHLRPFSDLSFQLICQAFGAAYVINSQIVEFQPISSTGVKNSNALFRLPLIGSLVFPKSSAVILELQKANN